MTRFRLPLPWPVWVAVLGGCGYLTLTNTGQPQPGGVAYQMYSPLATDLMRLGVPREKVSVSVYKYSRSTDGSAASALYTVRDVDGRTLRLSPWREAGRAPALGGYWRGHRWRRERADTCAGHLGEQMLWQAPLQSAVLRWEQAVVAGKEGGELVVWRRKPGSFSPAAAPLICVESSYWRR